MGYSYDTGSPSVVVNGFSGLVPINVAQNGLTAIASSAGSYEGNLNSKDDPIVTPAIPASTFPNTANTTSSEKSSVIGYDSQGNAITYDVYFTKTGANQWDVAVYNHADASTAGDSPFPYSKAPVGKGTATFDANGQMTTTGTVGPGKPLVITDPVSGQKISMDMSKFTQLAANFTATGDINGQAPNPVKDVKIGPDGTVSAEYSDGSSKPLYRIPLATVASPDNLTLHSGNVYSANGQSGVTVTGFPQDGGFGTLQSGALEESTVDLASELTDMIEAQKTYTANSKVFQTGSDLMDVLVNLQR
jgi:flagellar hook protein FlgE